MLGSLFSYSQCRFYEPMQSPSSRIPTRSPIKTYLPGSSCSESYYILGVPYFEVPILVPLGRFIVALPGSWPHHLAPGEQWTYQGERLCTPQPTKTICLEFYACFCKLGVLFVGALTNGPSTWDLYWCPGKSYMSSFSFSLVEPKLGCVGNSQAEGIRPCMSALLKTPLMIQWKRDYGCRS